MALVFQYSKPVVKSLRCTCSFTNFLGKVAKLSEVNNTFVAVEQKGYQKSKHRGINILSYSCQILHHVRSRKP